MQNKLYEIMVYFSIKNKRITHIHPGHVTTPELESAYHPPS